MKQVGSSTTTTTMMIMTKIQDIFGLLSSPNANAAFVSTGMVSFIPNVLFLLMPHYNVNEGYTSKFLSLGQAMAAGSLLGDVFLHTLFHNHKHDHDEENDHILSDHNSNNHQHHDHMENMNPNAGMYVLLGYIIFFATDIIVRLFTDNRGTRTSDHDHYHGERNRQQLYKHSLKSQAQTPAANVTTSTTPNQHQHLTPVSTSAIVLNLVADALHNFTDGLAIGVTYSIHQHPVETGSKIGNNTTALSILALSYNHKGGLLATIAILLHEIPHELGDFCTLVKAGYSTTQAIMAQFVTSIAAFTGTAVSILLVGYQQQHQSFQQDRNSNDYHDNDMTNHHQTSNNSQTIDIQELLLFVTAGGFIYLASTTLLPEVLNVSASLQFRIAQFASFCSGIGFLYLVSILEDHQHQEKQTDHHDHHHDNIAPPMMTVTFRQPEEEYHHQHSSTEL